MKKTVKFAFTTTLSFAAVSADSLACRDDRRYQLTELQNMEFEVKGCYEHSGRTCCSEQDTIKVRLKYEQARLKSLDSESVSKECLAAVGDALCYYCDGDFVSSSIFLTIAFRALECQTDSVSATAAICLTCARMPSLTPLWTLKRRFPSVDKTA